MNEPVISTTIAPSLLINEQIYDREISESDAFSSQLEGISNAPEAFNKKCRKKDTKFATASCYLTSRQDNPIATIFRKKALATTTPGNNAISIKSQLEQVESLLKEVNQNKAALLQLDTPPSKGLLINTLSKLVPLGIPDQYADIRPAVSAFNNSKDTLEKNFQLLNDLAKLSNPHQEIEKNIEIFSENLKNRLEQLKNINNVITKNQHDEYFLALSKKIKIAVDTFENLPHQLTEKTKALEAARKYVVVNLIPKLVQLIPKDETLEFNHEPYAFIIWAAELNRLCQLETKNKHLLSKNFWHAAIRELIDQDINLPYQHVSELLTIFQSCFDIPTADQKPFTSFESISPQNSDALSSEQTGKIQKIYSTTLEQYREISRQAEYAQLFHRIYESKLNQLNVDLTKFELTKKQSNNQISQASVYLKCFHNLLFKPLTEKVDYPDLSKEQEHLYQIVNQRSLHRATRQNQQLSDHSLEQTLEPFLLKPTTQSSLAEQLVNTDRLLYSNPDTYLKHEQSLTSKENQNILEIRYERLNDYIRRLNQIINSLQQENRLDATLKDQLGEKQKQAQDEIELITVVTQHSYKLQEIRQHIQQTKNIHSQAERITNELSNIINSKSQELSQNTADMNLAIYNLRTDAVNSIIASTLELHKKLKEVTEAEPTALREEIKNEYKKYLKKKGFLELLANSSKQSPQLNKYRIWKKEIDNIEEKISLLKTSFRKNLLELQQEQLRAQDNGGYPESLSWYSWAHNKLSPRALPNTLELNMQLATQGIASINIVNALNILRHSTMSDIDQTNLLSKFNDTVKGSLTEFAKLAKDYPTQTQMLAGDIQHFMKIMSASPLGISNECINMVKNAWSRGTTESIVRDLLLGSRSDIRGLTATPELSKETIACLYLISYGPYLANMMNGASLAQYIPGIGTIPGATQVINALINIAKTDIEKSLALTLTKNRDIEVAGNALLKSLATEGTITERIKTATNYIAGREVTRAVGTVTRDILEVGKVGALKRLGQEIALWWKHSTLKNKLTFIVTPIAIAASALVFFVATIGSVGIVPILLAIFVVLGGASIFVPILWRVLSKAIGWEKVSEKINQEINQHRIHNALNHIREDQAKALALAKPDNLEQLKNLLAYQKASLKNDSPEQNDLDKKLQENIESFFTEDVIRRWVESSMKTSNVKNPDVFRTTALEILRQKLLNPENP